MNTLRFLLIGGVAVLGAIGSALPPLPPVAVVARPCFSDFDCERRFGPGWFEAESQDPPAAVDDGALLVELR